MDNDTNELTRFDFTKEDRDDLNAAAAIGAVDAVGFGILMANFRTDVDAFFADLLEIAWAAHHHQPDQHKALCRILDARAARRRATQ
jgi:hypothetical protein